MSYGNEKTTVEKYFSLEFPYLLSREQRELGMKCGDFAEFLGISVESLENYRNNSVLPRSDTLFKIISKLRIEFVQDLLLTAGITWANPCASNQNQREMDASIIEKRGLK